MGVSILNQYPGAVSSLSVSAALDTPLALSNVKGEVSNLTILFQGLLASHCLVHAFVQGVTHIAPLHWMPVLPYHFWSFKAVF